MRPALFALLALGPVSPASGHPHSSSEATDVVPRSVTSLQYLDKLPDWTAEQRHLLDIGFDEAIDLAKYARWELLPPGKSQVNKNSKIFKKYFRAEDVETVLGVFQSLLSDSTTGSDRLQAIHFGNIDPQAACDAVRSGDPVPPGTIALYTTPWTLHAADKASFIFVCPVVWQLGYPRTIHDIQCEATCANAAKKECWPSARMATYGGLILHELIPKGLESGIFDESFKDTDGKTVLAYDSYYTQKLVKGAEKSKALYNADNYAMFAREVWFTLKCPLIKYKDPDHWESTIPNNLKPKPKSAGVGAGEL
ncbi:hypothetical protein SPBR_05079 [Sporothrix brasiliensis 5110]|uniref:Uncharacterized protein n=1 Tax=Sporothrix brasiliensis 5110 TaxID=1398154 RepID=A0A0C2IJZ3_9PEZI|nr:uncharacterized protein SPBR_05079 [Sporothrix brasiliensis 5110]KIH87295.1 hypothetical protein SPBR_05079 [Sporothrix brasiliensis 5110]